MRITGARVIVTSPGRNFVTLKVETDEGVHGIGDGTLNGRELAVASYLADHVVPMLEGRDPADIEDTWQLLYKGAYWRRGPVTMAAIAAVDMALWDIKGKVLGTPVHNLLGGRSRRGVLCYAHASGRTIEDTVEQVLRLREEGYRAIRAQCVVPGIDNMYGTPRGDVSGQRPDLPFVEDGWASEKYLRFAPELFARIREAVGFDVHLLHDAHHRLTPAEAGWLGRRLEDHQLFWLEDAVPAELQESFRVIRQHTTTPLAVGEVFNSLYDCHQLIREQLIDYIRASVVHAGGITHLRKIAHFAEPYHVRTGCHGAADLSPVSMAAALHFGLATHNAAIQEYGHHSEETLEVFPRAWSFADGYLHPGEAPGLGVDIDEGLAAKYEYQRGYLPVSRRVDGTVGSW
ncbi:D-mannonate dehydratase ManD [Actinopolymorpha singaporensis]|uniref:D-mannonate dehydratase n=1 Tax=Actinopolymorpha singaporensis TaxID=117157 RepID=A0A1H1WVD5_9ACTN|nr:D-mannonate dehydratase ManD [Actinopolymorpha singaporensis]SDT00651.1 D-mannonate dehydratase [Actinopolymorpha singaporensis]